MTRGMPSAVPDDGLSTQQRRLRPALIVNTGDGKGKSTAAFGTALRGWAQGWSIGVFQFVKSSSWHTGERVAFEALDALHRETGQGGPVSWIADGLGFTWTRRGGDLDAQAEIARATWGHVRELMAAQAHRLYVLDEFTYPLKWGWIDVDEVVETLVNRPGNQHVVITGRDAPQRLIDVADLVTEMTKVKHPMDAGQKGQRGIEW